MSRVLYDPFELQAEQLTDMIKSILSYVDKEELAKCLAPELAQEILLHLIRGLRAVDWEKLAKELMQERVMQETVLHEILLLMKTAREQREQQEHREN